MSTVGSPIWDGAPELWGVGTSDPTPVADLPVGGFPYHSGWWTITAPEDCDVIIDTSQSTTVSGYGDTYLIVYAGATEADSYQVASDDDGGGSGTSKVQLSMTAGEVYHIQVGTYGSDGSGVIDYLVRVGAYVWTDWMQPPDEKRTQAAWTSAPITSQNMPSRSASTDAVVPPPPATPDNARLSQAVFDSYDSVTTSTSSPPSAVPSLSTGGRVTVSYATSGSATFPNDISRWIYQTNGSPDGSRGQAGRIAFPDVSSYSPPSDIWPPGAIEVEVAPTAPEVLGSGLDYVLEEFSRDESGTPDNSPEDALGSWTYALSSSSDSVTVAGPLAYHAQVSGSIGAARELDADGYTYSTAVSVDVTLGGVQAHDPGFGIEGDGTGGGGYYYGQARWTPSATVTIRPPLVRYKVPAGGTPQLLDPARRLTGRGDSLGIGIGHIYPPPKSHQGGWRRAGGFI